jgi:hypothetical protein
MEEAGDSPDARIGDRAHTGSIWRHSTPKREFPSGKDIAPAARRA